MKTKPTDLLVVLGLLLLVGLTAVWNHSHAQVAPDPAPISRPAVPRSSAADELEQRVGAIERQQQRERAARDAELFAPRPQPTLELFPPSSRSLEVPAPRARDLGF